MHDVRDSSAERRQVQRGGFATAADAEATLQASLTATGMGVRVQEQRRLTVAAYLEGWLERKKGTGRFRPSTALNTGHHVHLYWIPLLGHYRLADLAVDDVDQALVTASRAHASGGCPRRRCGASTQPCSQRWTTPCVGG